MFLNRLFVIHIVDVNGLNCLWVCEELKRYFLIRLTFCQLLRHECLNLPNVRLRFSSNIGLSFTVQYQINGRRLLKLDYLPKKSELT